MSEDIHKELSRNSITWGTSGKEGQCKVYFDSSTSEEELERLIKLAFKGQTLINTIRRY